MTVLKYAWLAMLGLSATALAEAPSSNHVYKVNSGDCLWSIASKIYKTPTKWKAIAEWNHLKDPNLIQPGQELVLEDPEESSETEAETETKTKQSVAQKAAEEESPAADEKKADRTVANATLEETADTNAAPIFPFRPSLGLMTLGYQQTGLPSFTEIAPTVKVDYEHSFFLPNLDAGASISITAFTLMTTQSGFSTRFLDGDAHLAYSLPFITDPWKLQVVGGLHYSTMLASAAFGYQNILYPELFPMLSRRLNDRDTVGGYVSLAPLGSGLFDFDLSQRQLGVGLQWKRRFENARQGWVGGDFNDLKLTTGTSTIDSTGFTLSVGYEF